MWAQLSKPAVSRGVLMTCTFVVMIGQRFLHHFPLDVHGQKLALLLVVSGRR